MAVTLDNVPASAGGMAKIRIWKNGRLLANISDRKTLGAADDYSDRALLFTYWNGGAPKDQHMYVDEITITTDIPDNVDEQGNPYLGGLLKRRPVMVAKRSEERRVGKECGAGWQLSHEEKNRDKRDKSRMITARIRIEQ